MHTARETVLVAQDLYQRLGPGGVEVVEVQAARALGRGETGMAEFWFRVGRAIGVMGSAPGAVRAAAWSDAAFERNPTWALMQRIEAVRHFASEAERAAQAADGETSAGHLLAIATGWRQLGRDLAHFAGFAAA